MCCQSFVMYLSKAENRGETYNISKLPLCREGVYRTNKCKHKEDIYYNENYKKNLDLNLNILANKKKRKINSSYIPPIEFNIDLIVEKYNGKSTHGQISKKIKLK